MVTFRIPKNKNANKGAGAEKATQEFLEGWAEGHQDREVHRLVDSKQAGRIIKAAVADFDFYGSGRFGLIEVKETEHPHRIDRSRVTQLAAMRKRAQCGGVCILLVYHSTIQLWRAIPVAWLAKHGDKGSWNLSEFPLHPTVGEALGSAALEVFE
jgi:hypothetical protein